MNDKELTKEQSLQLITDMIGQAKRNFAKGGSFYFLLWGWVVMLANLGHYYLAVYTSFDKPYIVWAATIPAGIISGIYGARKSSNAKVTSHLDRMYGYIWMCIFFAVLIILFYMGNVNYSVNPIILVFAGLGTLLSGLMLRFKPLVFGGIAIWIAGIAAFNLPVNDQYLVGAAGLMVGYLIPGYLLRKAENA